jgi:TRAP-type C4-dicarboxylate transport system permease small subunit
MVVIEKLAGIYKVIDLIRKIAVVVLFAFIILSMGFQILLRNLDWTDEILRYVNIWVVFLGAGLAVKHSEHLQVAFFADKMFGGKGRGVLRSARLVIVILFLVAIAVAGVLKTVKTAALQAQMVPISIGWFYLAIPVGCLLMIMDYLLILLCGKHPFVNDSVTKEEPEC